MKETSLGKVLKLEYGKPLPEEFRSMSGRYPVYGANGEKGRSDKFFCDQPSVIVGRKGSAGELTLTDGGFWPLDVTYFVTHDEAETSLRFLWYLLQTLNLPSLAKGVKPGINRNEVYSIRVRIPGLKQQKRIVSILDHCFEDIAQTRNLVVKKIERVIQILPSWLNEELLFAKWPSTELGAVATIKGGKRVPNGYKLLSQVTPYPYLRVSNFTGDGAVDEADLRYVDEAVQRSISRYIIRKEDLYITIAGTIGRTGIIPPHLDGAQLTENACRLVFDGRVSNQFTLLFTWTECFKNQAIAQTRTTAQPKLALSRLSVVRMPLPPKVEQERIVARARELKTAVDSLKANYEQKLAALDALKQSLLYQAFSGNL